MSIPIRLIASDVDGTLFDDRKRIPPENVQAILEAQQKGIIFAIASGRFPEFVRAMMLDYGITCPVIGTNGGRIVDENLQLLSSHFMDRDAGLAVIHTLEENNQRDYFIFTDDSICHIEEEGLPFIQRSYGTRFIELGIHCAWGKAEILRRAEAGKLQKFLILGSEPLVSLRNQLSAIPNIDITQSSPNNLEVMPRGISKAYGLQFLAAHYSIPMNQVMALGDEENDIPMLQVAGYPVAMGNGSQAAKSVASFVTISNNDAGLAYAIKHFIG